MFEGYVVYYLNQYLGKYVDGIDQKSLRISIYKGDVVLKNLRLRPDALASLDLPVTVRAGLLGSLTLKVPWSSLGAVPVEVKVDRLFLLASPKSEAERGRGVQSEDGIEPAYQLAKRQRVAAQEEAWVQELAAQREQEEAARRAAGGAPAASEQGGGVGGMLKAVIDTVIGNLQLSISNVHIRYEDDTTNPGHPFACGLTLDSITGYTVDELGKEAFITNNPLQMLRKALWLRRMAVYFDTDAEFWQPPASWRQLAPHDWDDWFLPGIGLGRQERGSTARHRQYVLQPVDGRALYTRHGAGMPHKEDEPVVEMDFQLDVVAVRLSQPQYLSYHLLLAEMSSFTARMPHAAYRPRLRPAAGEQARLWWKYAVKAVQQQVLARKLSWEQAIKFARMRKEYVPLYIEHLRSPIDPSRPRDRLPKGIVDMDRQLPEQTIVMFRRLAHARLQREKRQQAAKEAGQGGKAGGGGWLDWLRGGGGGGSPKPAATATQEGEAAPELTPEEYSRLVELVNEQEQGLRLGTQTPFTLLSRISARVGSASALLVAADDTRVLRGGLEGIQLVLSKYPETLQVELGVTAMGVESPEGTFIQTGAQLQRLRSATDLTEEMEGTPESDAGRALAVTFVQKPQDGSADASLDVALMPSYVYYSASAVDRVVNFFKTPEQLDLTNLSAQATSQLERARRLAAQYAAAALRARPKLRLHLVLDGPKVAIPAVDAVGRATLALDFGRFIIESDFDTAGKLPGEEAALYECVRLNVCDMAAYVADGEFDWQAGDKGGQLVPLLQRTGMDIALQAARFMDPSHPVVRLQPSIPVLHFYLSPGRIGRMLRVIRAALPASEEEQAAAAAGTAAGGAPGGTGRAAGGPGADQELWRQHAEYEGGVRVLTWAGLGRTSVAWCPRHGIIYQGKLYLYEGPQPGAKQLAAEAVWPDRRVVRVPPDKIGGAEHVVALCPESLDLTRLAESTSSVVLRLDTEEQADCWYRHLQQAQQALASAVGEGAALLPPDWEEAFSTLSGTEADEAMATGGPTAAQGPPPGALAAAAGQAPSTVLQIDAQLGELAIFGSGREPSPWWPPPEEDDAAPASPPGSGSLPAPPAAPEGFVSVDDEVPLIVLRAAGGTCQFTYGTPGMTVHTALGSLEIEDLLVGPRCRRNRFLASSHAGVELVGDETFFDADDRLCSGGATPRAGQSPASPGPRGPACPAIAAPQDLAEFTFKLRQPGSPEYEGVDTSLDVSLSSLYFYCNRPTVAALITLGVDIGAVASAAFAGPEPAPAGAGGSAEEPKGEEAQAPCKAEGEQEGAGAVAAVAGVASQAAALGAGFEEAVDQAQLLGGAGGGDRSMFRLTASLGTLQVLLNYEGAGCHTLSQASVDRFSFELDVRPDTSMRIRSTLGNVQAVDCTLPEGHPYRQACGLREGSSTSLVSLEFCSFPPSYRHPAVPEGLQYYTLQAQLSELQLVFLYRFLQENLAYLSTMLAMRLPSLEAEAALALPPAEPAVAPPAGEADVQQQGGGGGESGGGSAAAATVQATASTAPAAQQQELQPFVLLMDVQASAPNICLPRHSDSLDSIDVDLGSLSLKTARIVSQPAPSGHPPLLMEAVDLTFSGVDCSVVQASKRGPNVFRNAESGWRLHWRRPLQPELRGEQPMFDLSLDLPFLKARLTDHEYQLITSVAADNFAELPELPCGARWLNDHYQAILMEQQQAQLEQQRQAAERAQQAAAGAPAGQEHPGASGALPRRNPQAGSQGGGGEEGEPAEEGPKPARLDKSRTSVRVAVSIGEIELEVHRHLEGLPQPLPLARFTIADLWVAFRNSEQGSMFVSVSVPRVEAKDLRPEVPPEQSLVISSAHKASFLMLDWAASPGMAHQALAMTLQKPLMVAELSFLLAVTQFVVPTFAFVKNRPIPFVTHDITLTGEPRAAEGDLFLCPAVRLLADTPGVCSYEYDGRGHRLVLPDKDHLDEQLPLILIGPGRTLRLRNVKVVNSASLAVCLQLSSGAKLLASPDDGVELLDSLDDELALQLAGAPAPSASASLLRRTLSPTRGGRSTPEGEGGSGALLSPRAAALVSPRAAVGLPRAGALGTFSPAPLGQSQQAQQAAQQQSSTIEIVLSAVGVGLQFVHLDSAGGPRQSSNSRPGSRPGSASASRHGSSANLSRTASGALTSPPAAGPAGAAGTAAAPAPARSVQMLAASFDLDLAYKIQASLQSGQVEVQGLRVETRFISDVAARLAQREQQDVAHKRKLRGRREGSVLDPCRLGLTFRLVAAGEGEDARPATTDVRLEASDLRLTLSPDVLELGGLLAASALEPLMQPQPDQPLASCNQFERVWSFDPAALLAQQPGGAAAVSLAVTGAEGGVTVWRPKTPTGYAVTGDVVTPGSTQPTFEVLAVAVNSGLAAYPTAYTRVWAGAGGAIWRPVPPPGYVAAGDVFTADEIEPELSAMVCLHEGTVVECAPGERLSLPPQLPHAPAAAAAAASTLPRVDLWCLDNSIGTFLAATPSLPAPEATYDLRSPLGLTPAALLAMGAAQEVAGSALAAPPGRPRSQQHEPPAQPARPAAAGPGQQQRQQPGLCKRKEPSEMFRTFQSSRRELRTETAARLVTPSVVDFRRICVWEGDPSCAPGSGGEACGVSIWRPMPPPGYVALGDCLVRGYDPPPCASVVQDTGAEEGFGHTQGMPLVKAPRGFEPAWEDGSSLADSRLVLWRPVPYPGYVSMGCVATLGTVPPPRSCIKCLRQDAATRASPDRTPTWVLRHDKNTDPPPLSAWAVDEKLHTFVAMALPPERAGQAVHAWKLRQPSSEQSEVPPSQQAAGGVNVVVKAGQSSVLLQDAFHVPLLEVSLGAVEAGVRGPSQAVVQAYLGLKLGVWSYNGTVKHWEPVVEPWDVIAQCAANYGTRVSSGIEPGVAVSIKSSNDCVYTTLAFSALHSMLMAYADWQQLHGGGGGPPGSGRAMRALLAAGEATAMHVLVDNRLGVESAMELDYGDRLELVKLPAGEATPIIKPLPSFPLRLGDAPIGAEALPHTLVLLDVQQVAGIPGSSSEGDRAAAGQQGGSGDEGGISQTSRQLYCSVRLEPAGAGAPGASGQASPASSGGAGRGMGGQLSPAGSLQGWDAEGGLAAPVRTRALPPSAAGIVPWEERLCVALPMRPAAEATLVFEVWDAAAAGGRGASLGSGRLTLPVRSLRHRQEHSAELKWELPGSQTGSSAGDSSASGSGEGDSSSGQQQQQGSREVQLQVAYMLQKQWSFAKAGGGQSGQDAWAAEASTAGQRALTLTSQPGTWAVVPAFGQQKSGTGASSSASASGSIAAGSASVIPLKIGKEGLVVESSVANGTRREVLRALCQVVNSTELTLEVCLVDVEDSDWQMVAARSGSLSGTFSADSVEEEVFENERFARSATGAQWAAANLRPEDPRRYQYALQQSDAFPKVDPPRGWEWESNWQLDHGPSTDADGWAYAPDFKQLHFPPPAGAQKPSVNDYVRRRRWVRRRRRTGSKPAPLASLAAALGSGLKQKQQEQVVTGRQVLGCAAPGEALPLPLGWSSPSRQLQLRPVLPVEAPAPAGQQEQQQGAVQQAAEQQQQQLPGGAPAAEEQGQLQGEGEWEEEEQGQLHAVHDWSQGTADGRHTLKLDGMDEGITRLVCCPSLHNTALGSAGSELELSDLWFSLGVEGDVLAASKQAKPMTDWRIVVSAPLRLTNQLPIAGSLLVWEQQAEAGKGDLVGRQTVQVASGATVPIHTADMRRVVSFTFYPEGYEWVEPAPAVLSEGYSGRGRGRQQLPDRFRLLRPGASAPLEVFIQRSIEWGTWLLGAKEELDPGAVVAMGVPMTATLLSPLWVVNATSLAIDAVIVPLEAPPPPRPSSGVSLRGRRMSGAASDTLRSEAALRTINTDDADPQQRGEYRQRRFVAPASMELLSYPLPSFLAGSPSQLALAGSAEQGQQAQQAQQAAEKRRRYGVRLRVAGSGWTPALALDAGEPAGAGGGAAGQQQQVDSLQGARPTLVRALVREDGLVHEVVARLEVSAFGTSQVLRLEPHVVVSNRTSVPLQLLQSRLDLIAPPAAAGGARPSGAVVAEGGSSFSQSSRSMNAALLAGGGPSLVRPSRRFLSTASQLNADADSRRSLASAASSLASLSSRWDRVPSLLPSGTSPLVQLSASSFRQSVQRNAVMDLPAGAAAVPLPLSAGLPNHTLSFRCVPPPAYAAAAAADALPLWSRPVTVRAGVESQMYVVVPVIPPEEDEAGTEHAGGQAEGSCGGSGTSGSDAAHLTALPGGRGSGDAAHLAPGHGSGGSGLAGWPPAVAILRLSVHRRGLGAMHVVLESMHSDPPYLLENRTHFPLQYRQAHVRGAPFHTLEPFSAAGYVWEYSMAGQRQELEMQEGGTTGASKVYALDAPDGEQDGEPAPLARMQPLPLSSYPHTCSVRVAFFEQVAMGASGVARIGGEGSGVLGRGGIDRVLQVAPGHEPLLTAGAKSLAPSRPDLCIAFELPGLEVSLVDHTPRELLLLSATELKAGVTLGSNPASTYKTMRLSVQRLQLDDMLTGTPFPVVLAPALQQPPGAGEQPVLAVTWASVLGGARGRSYLPLVAVRWPVALQLAISEALVWSAYELLERLQRDAAAAASAGGAGAAVAAADVPVRIRLLAVDSLSTQISFQGDPFSRPRDLAGGLVGRVIDLANFQAAPISLQGLAENNLVMLQSQLSATIQQHFRNQLFYVGLSLMRSFGLVGGTSRALGALSAAVAKLAGPSASASRAREQQEAKQKRSITDVGDGMLEGVGAIGTSMLRGFKGIFERPMEGAQQAGVQGAIKGVGKGLLGVVANPVSGVLEAMSATAEGFDATFGKPRDRLLVLERRRPARVISGEGKLMPLVRGGSTKQSRIEEIGQALLKNTLLAAPNGLRNKRQGAVTEAYEEHFVLPDDRVLLLTSAGILLVHAPGFAQLDGAAEIGAINVSDVAPGIIQWGVRWDDVLTFELRWSRELHYPDRLIVHRKGTPGWQEEESLAHQVKCFETTPQASQIKVVAQKVLRKYYLDPLRRNQLWSRRHDAASSLPAGTPLDQLPPTMPCLDFALTWHTNPHKSPVVSFWRPLAPAGYRAVGDVLSLGLEPPTAPVPCFRDDVGLRIRSAAASAAGEGEPPVAQPPREFSLIWRYNGKRPVTVWMPVAPPGYAALGAVVRGEPELPNTDEYLCVRSDLTSPAKVFNSPIWSYDPGPALQAAMAQTAGSSRAALAQPVRQFLPHHPETWKVSVWQVDNRLGTFIAVRSFSPPPSDVSRTVKMIEERAAARPAAVARQIPA
ncbi:hypothetical protein ABPG75_011321 [Micractinium tetrahymenae]